MCDGADWVRIVLPVSQNVPLGVEVAEKALKLRFVKGKQKLRVSLSNCHHFMLTSRPSISDRPFAGALRDTADAP